MVINIHAGHNPDGKTACGAVGLIKESTENRNVKNALIKLLKAEGHTVYDCTVDDGKSQSDVLKKIVAKCNEHSADLDISIHFNAGGGAGCEAYTYSTSSKSRPCAERVCEKISALGFKNRGAKTSASLYVLKNTKAPALLIECCFADSENDVKLYNADKMAKAIAEGVLNKTLTEKKETTSKYYPKYTGNSTSIITALLNVGEKDTSLAHRKKIATANGIANYKGTSSQNLSMIALLKSGKLVKA